MPFLTMTGETWFLCLSYLMTYNKWHLRRYIWGGIPPQGAAPGGGMLAYSFLKAKE
jgi:hypothetical protein